ncbi:MAG TPA: RDD family protein [Candidatus Limnocylindrales bacterium]
MRRKARSVRRLATVRDSDRTRVKVDGTSARPSSPMDGPVPGSSYATTGRRGLALVFDGAILAASLLAVGQSGLIGFGHVRDAVSVSLTTAVGFAYFALCWWRFAATLGQRALGLRVVDEVSGGRVSVSQAAVRWFFLIGIASAAEGLLAAAGAASIGSLASGAYDVVLLASIAGSAAHQGLHDRLARTVVLARPLPVPVRPLKVIV